MRWALTLTGTHVEGVDRTRFDKIVTEFVDRLNSNGYHLGFQDGVLDLEGEIAPVTLEVSNPPVAREAAKLTHHAFVEPPREVLDKWAEEDRAIVEGIEDIELNPVKPLFPDGPPFIVPNSDGLLADRAPDELRPVNVAFASDEAGELAIARGLTTRNFQGLEPSSANGFTVPDVKKAAKRAGK